MNHPDRHPGQSADAFTEAMRIKIATNLKIDVDRIRYNHQPETPGQFGEVQQRWEILYRDEWRELPWHFEGPEYVDRQLVKRWYGEA
ncbi:hypothetical protein LOC67_09305 [Stieleria sp. JC731]|uniref:hypothetical protein n=1 Tax=Pirellulaceae TaxID=2691357 RepID=UPI001E57D953|nr:hypothetical protein [Stieleria sp. JC731]MCC9600760.1 hypothetical protein [Stieleria sp. JC731]